MHTQTKRTNVFSEAYRTFGELWEALRSSLRLLFCMKICEAFLKVWYIWNNVVKSEALWSFFRSFLALWMLCGFVESFLEAFF